MTKLSKAQRKTLILSSLGGVLEFFDFIIYIFLVPYIEKLFFASESSYATTLKTLAVFSAGYLIRPLGGIIFSHFGDRHGRKVVFLMTVLFMAVPSFAIGLLPTTDQIGILAPLLLLAFRLMQGLAIGGEIPAAITFIFEHVTEHKKGIAMAVLFLGINAGLTFGSLAVYLLTASFTEQQILDFAWRFPFIVGGCFGIGAIILRRHLRETEAFQSLTKEQKSAIPLIDLLTSCFPKVLQGFSLVALPALCIFMYLYWPSYLHKYMGYDYQTVIRLNTLGTLMLNFSIIIGGFISDRFGYLRTYLFSVLCMLLFLYPLYLLFNTGSMRLLYLGYFIFTLLLGSYVSCYGAVVPQLFPTAMRYSGVALSYNLALAIFSGLSPVICTVLIHTMNSIFAPAWYTIAVACLTASACYYSYISSAKSVTKQYP